MISVTNKSDRGVGYAHKGEVIIVEPGETKAVPLDQNDARITGDLHAGIIEVKSDAASAENEKDH